MGRSALEKTTRGPARPLFGLRKLLNRYRRWYDTQLAINRRRIEEDARRFGGSVRWDQ